MNERVLGDWLRRDVLRIGGAATAALTMAPFLDQPRAWAAAGASEIRNLGEIPNYAVTATGSDIRVLPDGRQRLWMVVNGNPATVAEIDLAASDRVVWQLPLPGSSGGWAVASHSDGTVYAGSWSNGTLYRHSPGAEAFEALGRPTPETTYIWALDTDHDGNVYGGTYASNTGDGHVFGWNAASGRFRDYGPAVRGQAYVRALTEHDGMVYAGTGSAAYVVAIEVASGVRRLLGLPPGESSEGRMVQDLAVVGRYLYVRVNAPGNTFVYDCARQRWVEGLHALGFGRATSSTGPRGEVYLDAGGLLKTIDPQRGTTRALTGAKVGILNSLQWIPDSLGRGEILAGADETGAIVRYSRESGLVTTSRPTVKAAPVFPRCLAEGPDGNVYVGGYMSGGLATFDPQTHSFGVTQKPIGQIESMGSHDGKLYIGTYAGAVIHAYDPAQAWDVGVNPRVVTTLSDEGQDRPFAITSAGQFVAIGTVPAYGRLGGVLTLYDPAADSVRSWRNLVPDQSVISLAYRDGVIYGGTSIWGGLGIEPTATEGKLFAFDTETGQLLWQMTPVPGDGAVSSLEFGPNGDLWGITGGNVFRVDLSSRDVTVVAKVAEIDWSSIDHYWNDGYLRYNEASGQFHGAASGRVFSLDPTDASVTTIRTDTWLLLQHSSKNLFWTEGYDLVKAEMPV